MKRHLLCLVFSFPILIMLTADSPAQAQRRGNPYGAGGALGVGVGVGYGPYWGPGWGPYYGPGWGPGWGYPAWGATWMPNYYNGTWGNGLSMYGPPVPTHKPVPGMYGGGDSRFFGLPPLYGYSSWMYVAQVPLTKPAPLPPSIEEPAPVQELLPAPKPVSGPVELEVTVPTNDAVVYIDGTATKSSGLVRRFQSPPIDSAESYTYELRAEWKADGLTYTHTRRVTVKPGEKAAVSLGK